MSDKLKFTKGPWKEYGGSIYNSENNMIVTGFFYDDGELYECKNAINNLNLIAAAPEMLEALIELVKNSYCEDGINSRKLALLIEKATGLKIEEIIE